MDSTFSTASDPRQKNLVQVLLNSDVDTEQSHDALYDVSVLMKVYWKYLESHFVGTVSQFRSSWLETHFETRVKRQVEKMYLKQKSKKQKDGVIVYNGWL